MSFSFNVPHGTKVTIEGVEYAYQGVIDGRLFFMGTKGALMIPDEVNGGSVMPDEVWFMEMLRRGAIEFAEPVTGSAIRQVARAQEYSPDEILEKDPEAAKMHFVCTQADERNTKRGNKALGALIEELWSDPEVRKKYGDVPPKAATVRHHLKHRGAPGDRPGVIRTKAGIAEEPVAELLCEASNGIIGQLSKIVKEAVREAVRRGDKTFDVDDLAYAVDAWSMRNDFCGENPFRRPQA